MYRLLALVCLFVATTAWAGRPGYFTGATNLLAISSDLLPVTDDTYDLGSATFQWQDLYLDGILYADRIDTGDINADDGTNALSIANSTGIVSFAAGVSGTTWTGSGLAHAHGVDSTGNVTASADVWAVNSYLSGILDAPDAELGTLSARDGALALTLASSTGKVTAAGAVDVSGLLSPLASVNVTGNVTASGNTYAVDAVFSGDVQAADYDAFDGAAGLSLAGTTGNATIHGASTILDNVAATLQVGTASSTSGATVTLFDGGANKPGAVGMYVAGGGSAVYVWPTSTNTLRYGTAYPTNPDSDGAAFGGFDATADLDLSATGGSLGDPDLSWDGFATGQTLVLTSTLGVGGLATLTGGALTDTITGLTAAGVTIKGFAGDADLLQVADASVERWAITTTASGAAVVRTITDNAGSSTWTYDGGTDTFSGSLSVTGGLNLGTATGAANGTVVAVAGAAGTLASFDDGQEGGVRWALSSTRNSATDIDVTLTLNGALASKTIKLDESNTSYPWQVAGGMQLVSGILNVDAGVYTGAYVQASTYFCARGGNGGIHIGGTTGNGINDNVISMTDRGTGFAAAAAGQGDLQFESTGSIFGIPKETSGFCGLIQGAQWLSGVQAASSNWTVGTTETCLVYTLSAANYTVTLPAPSTTAGAAGYTGRRLTIKCANTDADNTVTVSDNASELIDGAATVVLSPATNLDALTVVSTGTTWIVEGHYGKD